MSRCNIYDPETNLWACWSTTVDDYVTEWLPENEYKAKVIADMCLSGIDIAYSSLKDIDFKTLTSVKIEGNKAIITVNNLDQIKLNESTYYTKSECDEKVRHNKICETCTHAGCDYCDREDHYIQK